MIVSDPAGCQGQPLLAGTRVTVSDVIASYLYKGFSPEELAIQFNLTLAQVHTALAYYYMHKTDIEDTLRRRADEADALLDELDKLGKLIRIEQMRPREPSSSPCLVQGRTGSGR